MAANTYSALVLVLMLISSMCMYANSGHAVLSIFFQQTCNARFRAEQSKLLSVKPLILKLVLIGVFKLYFSSVSFSFSR